MTKEVKGTVVSAARQWWLKINTKPVRLHAMDGATFPYILKVQYEVSGKPIKSASGYRPVSLCPPWVRP